MHDDLDLRDFDGLARLFPLPGVVHFPHVVLPLHIFEPRYRQMTRDALAGDKLIAIVQLRPGSDPLAPGRPPVEPVGCLGRILQHQRLPDGRFNLLLLGRKRVRLVEELDADTPYRQARVEVLEDFPPVDPADTRRAELLRLFRDAARIDPEFDELLRRDLPLGTLTDLIAHAIGLPPSLKQALLAELRVESRADTLLAVLGSLANPPECRRPDPPFSLN